MPRTEARMCRASVDEALAESRYPLAESSLTVYYRQGMSRPVAVFDIDGTVFRSSLLLELVERLIARELLPASAGAEYAEAHIAWLDRRSGYEPYIDTAVQLFVEHIKGVPYQTAADLAGEIIEQKRDRVYRYTRDLIRSLKGQGYFILGISRSPKFIVDGFGYEHGFDKTYGSFFSTGPSGNFTGEVEDDDIIANKAAVLQRAVRKEALTLEGSVGVGDTENDIPMLELVETPIAFNPNRKLYDHAKRRGWDIVVERKDVVYEFPRE